MSAKSSKGITICMTGDTSLAGSFTELAVTAVSKAKMAALTVAANPAKGGDVVTIAGTGFPELDGKTFIADTTSTATSLVLIGADTTNSTGTITVASAKAKVYDKTNDTCLCLSALSINADTPGTVSVGTYCDPTASIPASATQAGTLSFAGYVDTAAVDYPALLAAAEDGKQRIIRINLPSNGYIVAPVTISSITWDLPLDGAVSFSGSAVLGSKPVHRF